MKACLPSTAARASLAPRLGLSGAHAVRARPLVCHALTVKVCGVTNAADAELAAREGANLIGMIMWPRAKRSVSDETARSIVEAARRNGAEAVGAWPGPRWGGGPSPAPGTGEASCPHPRCPPHPRR